MSKVDKIVEMAKSYYQGPGYLTGGLLHIVLDDGNLETKFVEYCLNECKKAHDKEGIKIAKVILSLSMEEREEMYDRYDEYNPW